MKKVRKLYQRLDEGAAWARYAAALRERYPTLRALQEELARAKLLADPVPGRGPGVA